MHAEVSSRSSNKLPAGGASSTQHTATARVARCVGGSASVAAMVLFCSGLAPGLKHNGPAAIGLKLPETGLLTPTGMHKPKLKPVSVLAKKKDRKSRHKHKHDTRSLPAGAIATFPSTAVRRSVCADAPLVVYFKKPPRCGSSGKIRVFDQRLQQVAVLDMAASVIKGNIKMERRAFVKDNAAIFYLPTTTLKYGTNYSVLVDEGVLYSPTGKPFVVNTSGSWTFQTRDAKSSRRRSSVSVALNSDADFCTIHAAIDAIVDGNVSPILINIAPGTYFEIVHWKNKHNIKLRGSGSKITVIEGVNDQSLNHGAEKRPLVCIRLSRGIEIAGLAIRNLANERRQKQSEALAMIDCEKCIIRKCLLVSQIDTAHMNGTIYVADTTILGKVDYIWGTGTVLFERCELRTIERDGKVVHSRSPQNRYGYVFLSCIFSFDFDASTYRRRRPRRRLGIPFRGIALARISGSGSEGCVGCHVALVDCVLWDRISPIGWNVYGNPTNPRLWEYQSRDSKGHLVDVTRRHPTSKQLTEQTAALMRNRNLIIGF